LVGDNLNDEDFGAAYIAGAIAGKKHESPHSGIVDHQAGFDTSQRVASHNPVGDSRKILGQIINVSGVEQRHIEQGVHHDKGGSLRDHINKRMKVAVGVDACTGKIQDASVVSSVGGGHDDTAIVVVNLHPGVPKNF
jgi:hypothetical protein